MSTKKMKYSRFDYAIAFVFFICSWTFAIDLGYMIQGILSIHSSHKTTCAVVFLVTGVICLFCLPFIKEMVDNEKMGK